jgi:dihydrofolate reductase
MRKIIVFTNLTLDGVMQAPARSDEDLRGDFRYGGWGVPYQAMSYATGDSFLNTGAYLFGRKTYMDFYAVWPNRNDSPYSEMLNQAPKYIASTTLKEPLPWANSILLNSDVAHSVAELKAQAGKDFLVIGSGELIGTLMQHHLVDLFVLLIHPLVLGTGRRLFPEGSPKTALQLRDLKSTPNGVVIATYQPVESSAGKYFDRLIFPFPHSLFG